ncbi:hypothetical protein DFH07DRAFT_967769 [Mycena maculata]|uniref:N-acetyltransferase domain-containing protein n=1 Tax=Mycena maculata TaxID=230809 RepID=A0AAD7I344_9AGAR|nr:hypothetical protein DFH07DRAFT_967769 [Mycena maculata]
MLDSLQNYLDIQCPSQSDTLSAQLAKEEFREAARVLHEAFHKRYFLPALGGDETLVEPFLLAHVRATIIGGQLFIAELPDTGIVGVALWFRPGEKFLSSDEQRNAGWNETMELLGDVHRKWWDNFLSLCNTVPDELYGPSKKLASYHLQTFGVLPAYQKKGYGMALMAAVEEKAKLTSADVVLKTMGESAVPIYEKFGFEVLGPIVVKTPHGEGNAYCFRKHTGLSASD